VAELKGLQIPRVILGTLFLMAVSANAFGLTGNYNETSVVSADSFSTGRYGISNSTYYFNVLPNNHSAFTDATITLTGLLTSGYSSLKPNLEVFSGVIDAGNFLLYKGNFTFNGGSQSITLDLQGLSNLNSYIANDHSATLALSFAGSGSKTAVTSLNLSGHTVAPEPISFALVAAGLVALPFASRFRKYLKG
jgi:hypothetical protein